MPFINRIRRTAASRTRIFMSCVPSVLSSRTENGATSSGGNMCWTNRVSVSGMRPGTMCSTPSPPPIGASWRHWSFGVNNGRNSAIPDLLRKVWIAASATAAMSVRVWSKYPPSTRGRLSGRWRPRVSVPTRAIPTAGSGKPTPCSGRRNRKLPL